MEIVTDKNTIRHFMKKRLKPSEFPDLAYRPVVISRMGAKWHYGFNVTRNLPWEVTTGGQSGRLRGPGIQSANCDGLV